MKKFKEVNLTGNIEETLDVTREEWEKLQNGMLIDEEQEDEEDRERHMEDVVEDGDPLAVKIVTTHGEFFVIAHNDNGHGNLLIVQEVPSESDRS